MRGGGASFADTTSQPQIFEWSKSAPDWRVASMGLSLEGQCQNTKCKAYKSMVIINMGAPVIFKLGIDLITKKYFFFNNYIKAALKFDKGLPTEEQKTNCPICDEHVKPVLCALNNCSWRYFGIKDTKNGYVL